MEYAQFEQLEKKVEALAGSTASIEEKIAELKRITVAASQLETSITSLVAFTTNTNVSTPATNNQDNNVVSDQETLHKLRTLCTSFGALKRKCLELSSNLSYDYETTNKQSSSNNHQDHLDGNHHAHIYLSTHDHGDGQVYPDSSSDLSAGEEDCIELLTINTPTGPLTLQDISLDGKVIELKEVIASLLHIPVGAQNFLTSSGLLMSNDATIGKYVSERSAEITLLNVPPVKGSLLAKKKNTRHTRQSSAKSQISSPSRESSASSSFIQNREDLLDLFRDVEKDPTDFQRSGSLPIQNQYGSNLRNDDTLNTPPVEAENLSENELLTGTTASRSYPTPPVLKTTTTLHNVDVTSNEALNEEVVDQLRKNSDDEQSAQQPTNEQLEDDAYSAENINNINRSYAARETENMRNYHISESVNSFSSSGGDKDSESGKFMLDLKIDQIEEVFVDEGAENLTSDTPIQVEKSHKQPHSNTESPLQRDDSSNSQTTKKKPFNPINLASVLAKPRGSSKLGRRESQVSLNSPDTPLTPFMGGLGGPGWGNSPETPESKSLMLSGGSRLSLNSEKPQGGFFSSTEVSLLASDAIRKSTKAMMMTSHKNAK